MFYPAAMPESSKSVKEKPSAQSLVVNCCYAGYLNKEAKSFGGRTVWKKRYVIIKETSIYFFDDAYSRSQRGNTSLFGYNRTQALESPDEHGKAWPPNSFVIRYFEPDAQHQALYLQAATPDEREGWLLSIRKALITIKQEILKVYPGDSDDSLMTHNIDLESDGEEYIAIDEKSLEYTKPISDKAAQDLKEYKSDNSPSSPRRPPKPAQLQHFIFSKNSTRKKLPHVPVPLPETPQTSDDPYPGSASDDQYPGSATSTGPTSDQRTRNASSPDSISSSGQSGVKSMAKEFEKLDIKPFGNGGHSSTTHERINDEAKESSGNLENSDDDEENVDSIGYVDMDPNNPPEEFCKPNRNQAKSVGMTSKAPGRPEKPIVFSPTTPKRKKKRKGPRKPGNQEERWQQRTDSLSEESDEDSYAAKPALLPKPKYSSKEQWTPRTYYPPENKATDVEEISATVKSIDHNIYSDTEGELESEEELARKTEFDSVDVSKCFFYDDSTKATVLLKRQAKEGSFIFRPNESNSDWEMLVYNVGKVIKLPVFIYEDATIGLLRETKSIREEDKFNNYVTLLNYCRLHDIVLASHHQNIRLTGPHESCSRAE